MTGPGGVQTSSKIKTQDGRRAFQSLLLHNFLSFGHNTDPFELLPLNVLIGPNGSGKSNLIEAFTLLQGTPSDLAAPIREGGTVREWLWKGANPPGTARLEAVVSYPKGRMPLRYCLSFGETAQRFEVTDERIENVSADIGYPKPYFYFGYEKGHPMVNVAGKNRTLHREEIDTRQSVLSQRKDPDTYPELTYIASLFGAIRVYRNWGFGRLTPPRVPQPTDLPNDFLSEDARNLGLILNWLERDPQTKSVFLQYLRELLSWAGDVGVLVQGGTVQIFLEERGRFVVPATRLSDGTLRWISLLAILLHPNPPPLVCIEEPELGLHPDLLPSLAQLLKDASERMQLVITTHSDVLVDALNDVPDAVVVCENPDGSTRLRRLSAGALSGWLEKYTLGQLWRSGEIGGNRF